MKEASVKFAAVYIRVSTDEQTELSPETQLEKIREHAKREGIVILQDHIYIDAGISGKKAEKRPEFMRMIAAAKEKDCPFTTLLVWKFSRFARNQEESIFYKSILRSKCGVDVVSVSEPLIAGHFGSLIERIIEWMDEFYSIRLSEEVKRSMEVNARRGKLQSTPSFGYYVENGTLVPKQEEADLVRWIFRSFADGKGLYPIARELNTMGTRTHRGNRFENRTIEYILRNPVYIGKLRWNPTGRTSRKFDNENIIVADSTHEPLIDMELWEEVQKRMAQVKEQWGYKARPTTELKHWLSGLIRCSACGTTLIFSAPHYYKCSNYARGACRSSQHVKVDILVDALISQLEADAEALYPLAYTASYSAANGGADIARLETSLRDLARKKERLQDAYLSGVIELADFATAKQNLDISIDETKLSIARLKKQADRKNVQSNLQNAIRETLTVLQDPTASLQDKNNSARSILHTCVFDKENSTLTITYRTTL